MGVFVRKYLPDRWAQYQESIRQPSSDEESDAEKAPADEAAAPAKRWVFCIKPNKHSRVVLSKSRSSGGSSYVKRLRRTNTFMNGAKATVGVSCFAHVTESSSTPSYKKRAEIYWLLL
jgi:hypothetical protein